MNLQPINYDVYAGLFCQIITYIWFLVDDKITPIQRAKKKTRHIL